MTLVQPGDVVFSFHSTKISAMGRITSVARESSKPDEFGNAGAYWDSEGWRVDVQYDSLEKIIRPKDFIEELRPTLPEKYSPLQKTGDGLQSVYLAEVPAEMAEVLISLIGDPARKIMGNFSSGPSTDELDERVADKIETEFNNRTDIPETEKQELRKSRRGQGRFRGSVLKLEPKCRITGVSNPKLLIASHIKPWARCNENAERLDGNNGLMLTPNVDHLFDKGFISFDDEGVLLISDKLSEDDRARLNIEVKIEPLPLSQEQKPFMDYHRQYIFQV
jgi:putative restriction endonuclease